MGFKVRGPSLKIGGIRLRKTKSGWTMSSKTILGNRKTTNLKTGKTTKTYKSIIPGKSTQVTKSANGDVKVSKRYAPSVSILGTRIRKTKEGVSVSGKNILGGTTTNLTKLLSLALDIKLKSKSAKRKTQIRRCVKYKSLSILLCHI